MTEFTTYIDDKKPSRLAIPGYVTEPEAQQAFAGFVNSFSPPLFKVFEQVRGVLEYKHHRQDDGGDRGRCDVLLLPVDGRIQTGAIVVEIKKSGEKIGTALSQVNDYLRCSFPVTNGICVRPSCGFVFPFEKRDGETASWMAHQSIGTCDIKHGVMRFWCGEQLVLELREFEGICESRGINSGRKTFAR